MAFSEIEKLNIKERLIMNCEQSWSRFGYKKTSLDDLCQQSGISKGSFYLFYHSKEELFCEVMIQAQQRLVALTGKSLGETPTKPDLAATLKLVYREYSRIPFLVETQSPDFIAFINRLSPENLKELENHGNYDIQKIIKKTGLTYRIPELKALSALALVFTFLRKDQSLLWDYLDTFDFILEMLIENIFE